MSMTWTPPAPHERQPDPRFGVGTRSARSAVDDSGPGLDRSDIPAPLPGRPLWAIFGTILVLAGLVSGTFNVISLLAHEERVSTRTYAAAELTTIDVDTDAGRVQITGTDGDEITVTAEISRGLRETGVISGVEGTTLVLESTCPLFGSEWCWVNYTIDVPRNIDVVVNSDDGVTVRSIDGNVRVNTDNGRATLSSITGALSVDADNGRVEGTDLSGPTADISADNGRIELAFSEPPDLVVASSDNGSIDIALPLVDGDYRVEADAANGRENIEIAADPASTHVIRANSDNGSITIRSTN